MTISEFIKTIKTAGVISGSQENIAMCLYEYSGIPTTKSTIHAILRGKRSPRYTQGSINEPGFVRYFEERTISTWPQMQATFSTIDKSGIIDCDTTERHKFYESLLALFYDILRLVPVSLCNILPKESLTIGRDKELEQLFNVFQNNSYAILSGIGGIGKSCVALAYAYKLIESENWTVQHVICENADTLQNAINKLQFSGVADVPESKKNAVKQNFENRIRCLKNSIKHMLIILDNLNRPFTPEDQAILKKLAECGNHIQFLITSRSKLVDDKRCLVNLSPLDDDALLKLYVYHRFEDFNDHMGYITQQEGVLIKLFSLIERHTLLVILLAKLPSRIFINEHEIFNRLASGLPIPPQGIGINKDGEMIEIPAEGLVKMLFDISDMTDCERSVMRYMSIMPPTGIEIKLFEKLAQCSRKEILSLKRNNWIFLDEEKMTIRLHPLICETILRFDDTKPTENNCSKIIAHTKEQIKLFEEDSPTRQMLNKILACVAENICFRAIASSGMLDLLKDYYREPILFFNEWVLEYMNAETFDGWVPQHTLFIGDDDENDDD